MLPKSVRKGCKDDDLLAGCKHVLNPLSHRALLGLVQSHPDPLQLAQERGIIWLGGVTCSEPIRKAAMRVEQAVAVDTFFVGTLKGVGKISLQTAIDCHSRYAWARLYPSKLPVTAVHLMNCDVLPTFEANEVKIETVLSDNGREFCGRPD